MYAYTIKTQEEYVRKQIEEAWQSAHVLYLTSGHHYQFGFTHTKSQVSSSLQLIHCAMHTYGWQLYIYYKFYHEVAIILKVINYEMLIIRMCYLFWIKRARERGSLMTTKKRDLVAGPLRLYILHIIKKNQYAFHLSNYVCIDVKIASLSIIYPIKTNGIRLKRLSREFNSQIIYVFWLLICWSSIYTDKNS